MVTYSKKGKRVALGFRGLHLSDGDEKRAEPSRTGLRKVTYTFLFASSTFT